MELLQQYVSLSDARFFAYHGYYPEEQLIGNEFWVNIETCMSSSALEQNAGTDPEQLDTTINYEQLYAISKSAMLTPRKLLETVAHDILSQIKKTYPLVEEITVSIGKSNPPFGGDHLRATVKLHWKKTGDSC